ncbi:LCP family glycopolymer transferase CpsA [Streptococcus thermophilus]|uniref:LCP family glycopolymer transferase CpsA n=1 Tax=Streptococcus thermophilus TaxID=1308 RepID=UPI0021820AB5|nr:LCP family protein [Streptococcus thermophilus]MCS9982859.1 LytR family transcriptional regulator [Streptococcus thermophilus]MCS9985670.1 LytR family transcriptional regulator [Streptococcus thermophilus]MCS9994698.1 LytR family transcriptional regulator [Streptococcus thermophilus]MCT0262322.1 LytR family transcriptional regulator [Streptococcus thermophilus]MCT1167387.1 LytR family transcriptional regulator [Streptococcus thermophilus]
MSSRTNRKQKHTSNGSWGMVNVGLTILYAILALVLLFTMFNYNFLSFRFLNIIITIGLLVVLAISIFLQKTKKSPLVTTVVLVIFSLVSLVGISGFKQMIDITNRMNQTAAFSEVEMSIVVPKESDIKDVSQLTSVQAPTKVDKNNIEILMSALKKDKKVDVKVDDVASYQEAYDNLKSGKTKAMVLSGSYASLLESVDSNFASNLKIIYTYKIKKKNSNSANQVDSRVFNIYISGIDTYGPISTVSRSDVNIIMTVNMNTHKILLTTTPRDAYVKIPGGGADQYDKLTHAGIYGVETSEQTLEDLYGIKIDYYARINFTSFLKLIDQLGGVTVHNDQAFTQEKFDFPVGDIQMNSEQALGFVRERYDLDGGDNDRGKNQEKVISAILNKLASLKSVSNFTSIVNNLQDSVQTNMPLNTINALANTQLESGSKFTVTSQAVIGTGSTGQLISYAMPNSSLYMMKLDNSSVESASQAIKNLMEEK